jgi:hypothetical protein
MTSSPSEQPTNASAHHPLHIDEPAHPYEHGGLPFRCQYCVGQTFRRSRLRAKDIKYFLLMRYPVRCLRCRQRQLVSFTLAGISIPSHVRTRRNRSQSSQG